MNEILNYLIEANLALVFFYACFWVLFHKENQFSFKRAYLLGSLVASLLFPLISIPSNGAQLIPSLSNTPAVLWLPEIIVYANKVETNTETPTSIWQWISYIYGAGLMLCFIIFVIRITSLIKLFISSKKYRWKNYIVAESEETQSSFSFFRLIFVGQTHELTAQEIENVLIHEEAHVQRYHSIDVVFINILGIVFWFNPVIHLYRNSLVQIHEFEADARSVEGRDVNAYCSLLARVALQSNGYPLANHFTNSFTLKRITMMKTVRKKIKQWKMVTASLAILLIFFVVACQDQVMQDIQTIADNSSAATILPTEVEAELLKLKENNPKSEYIVLEMNEEGKKKMAELDKNPDFTKNIKSISVIKAADQSFVILQKGDKTDMLSNMTAVDGEIFTIVEESASPTGGFPKLYEYIGANIKYPQEARTKGIEGKVFVEFIVNTDGSLSDIHIIKGIGAGCDEEAVRVIQGSSQWTPGKQRGAAIRQRMVIPIVFDLGTGNPAAIIVGETQNTYQNSDLELIVSISIENVNGVTRLSGMVKNENGSPLPGTNVLINGTTKGTVTDLNGNYLLDSNSDSGVLVFSFIGYKTKFINY
jgi:TonB family protein